jgi:hypothetical protein
MHLLCRIGIHRFRPWAWNSVIEPLPIERCDRCGVGRKFLVCGAEIRYSVDTMAEADEDLARREAEAS